MKKILLFSVLSMFLFSCSSDDDIAPEERVAGTWKMTSYRVENSYDFDGDGLASYNLIPESNCYQNETIQINTDGTATATSTSYLSVIGTLIAGSTDQYTYMLNCENETDTFPLTWTINGDSLVLTDEDGFSEIPILIFSNQFSFIIPEAFEIISSDGSSVITEENVTVIYTKQ